MKEKIMKHFDYIIGFLALIVGILYFISSKNLNKEIIYLGYTLLVLLGCGVINELFLKEKLPYQIKNDMNFLLIFFILLGVVTIILNLSPAFLFGIAINCVLFYLFLSKNYFEEKYISLIIFGILSLLINEYIYIVYLCLTVLGMYLLESIDVESIYRKKNVGLLFFIEIIMGLAFITNFHFIAFLLLFLIYARKKFGTKPLIKISIIPILTVFVLWLVNYFVDYTSFLPEIKNVTNIVWLIPFLIIGIIIGIKTLKVEKNTIIKSSVLILLGGMLLFPKENSYVISLIIPISILLGIDYDYLPKVLMRETKIKDKHTNTKPKFKVSAVIPNYNYENYIIERIDSVLFQTYPVTELIVLDDVSKDNSVEVIEKKLEQVKKDYPNLKVKFIPNKVNSGNVFKQWRKCFEESSGDYLWICEADDSASPYFLETMMKFFEKDPEVVLAHSESLTMDENNKLLMKNLREWVDIYKTDKWLKDFIDSGKEFNKNYLVVNNTIANVSGAVFKKKKGIPFGEFLKKAEEYKLAGDWYFYENVLDYGKIAYSNKSLNYHRMHSSSVTLTTKREKEYQEIRQVQEDIMKRYKIPEDVMKKVKNRIYKFKKDYGFSDEEIRLNGISWDKLSKKMKEDVMLSIIIPVYNTEPFLEKCLNSVLKEIPPKTEVIIINDGTPDNSEKIIKEFEKKYPTIIKYFKKKNGGLSHTKNYGLEKAKGKYIGFLDSDDSVKTNMFSCMLKKAILEDSDIVYCDVELTYEDGSYRYMSSTNLEVEDELMKCLDTPLMPASWSKIVKKELFKDLTYPVGYNNEDIAVSPILFARSKKTKTIPSAFYKYFQRTGSIQNSGFSEKRFVAFHTAELCFERAKEFDKETQEKIKGTIYTHQLFALLFYLIVEEKDLKKRLEFIEKFQEEINQFEDYESNSYLIEFVKNHNRPKLFEHLKNSNPKRIDFYLKTGI